MKILLQDFDTGLYLAETGSWTNTIENAMAFLNAVRATEYKLCHRLAHVFAVVRPATRAGCRTEFGNRKLSLASKISSMKKTRRSCRSPQIIPLPAPDHNRVNNVPAPPIDLRPTGGPAPSLPPGVSSPEPPVTTVQARIDVGLGNALFIRGQGGGLNWDKGAPLTCVDADFWTWSQRSLTERCVFKLLLNDNLWAQGDNLILEPGQTVRVVPRF